MTHPLDEYNANSGTLVARWIIDVQTIPRDVDRILDAIMVVHPLDIGIYQRNANISAVGLETAQPEGDSTTDKHVDDFVPGGTETYPMVWMRISVERDRSVLEQIMDQILDAHQHEQPVVFVYEGWASRSNYDPDRSNPNRWWNDGQGLPARVEAIEQFLTAK